MSEKTPVIPNQWVQAAAPASDEIDLRELLLVLWRQKLLIILVTVVFAAIGIGYALLAPQVWSAKAVIVTPEQQDMLPLTRAASAASALGLTGFPDSKTLYTNFTYEFNLYENQRTFLMGTPFFKDQVAKGQLDERGQRRWLQKWAKLMTAEAVDKKAEKPGIVLQASANDGPQALVLLNDYIQFIITKQQQRMLGDLAAQRETTLISLQSQMKLMTEDAELARSQEIANTEKMIAVASAAGVERPLENYNNGERFPITLGTKGLQEKLNLLKAMPLNVYQPKLVDLQVQADRLKQVKLENVKYQPFSYFEAPREPMSREQPKRPLIVVLATLLGGMLGVGIVLIRHAFRRPEPM
ncbi:MAG: LPS O-antigen chain length determinant protein WzzB [Aeromonas sp.]